MSSRPNSPPFTPRHPVLIALAAVLALATAGPRAQADRAAAHLARYFEGLGLDTRGLEDDAGLTHVERAWRVELSGSGAPVESAATTISTAAWDRPETLQQTPGGAGGAGDAATVTTDYSAYDHSAGDRPENTTEREPQNMVRAVKLAGLALVRLAWE